MTKKQGKKNVCAHRAVDKDARKKCVWRKLLPKMEVRRWKYVKSLMKVEGESVGGGMERVDQML